MLAHFTAILPPSPFFDASHKYMTLRDAKQAVTRGSKLVVYKYQYRQLLKRIYKLPVERVTMVKVIEYTKSHFKQKRGNNGLYKRSVTLLDEILVQWNMGKLTEVLNTVYCRWNLKLIHEFDEVHYLQLKPYWPSVHLIDEFGTRDAIKVYHQTLKNETVDLFSTTSIYDASKGPDASDGLPTIGLVNSYSIDDKRLQLMIDELKKIYLLYYDNQEKLIGKKVPPFEAVYPTNRVGRPVHVSIRDRILHDQISLTKNLINRFKPIEKSDLKYLYEFSIHKPIEPSDYHINPNFFKFMMKTKHNVSPTVQKSRVKHLVPSDNNIRKIYRDYVRTSFYLDENNDYKMSWLKDFWENDKDRSVVKNSLGTYYKNLQTQEN